MEQSRCSQNISLRPAFDDQDLLGDRLIIGTSLTENFEFAGFVSPEI
jgi:hypothetical protein